MSKFKFGMRVWSPTHGWGTVDAVSSSDSEAYPVCVVHDSEGYDYFTADGKLCRTDLLPLLFLDEVKEWPDPPAPLPQLAIDTPVWGSTWTAGDMWPCHFAGWNGNQMQVWMVGTTSHTHGAYMPIILERWSLTNPNIVSTETEGTTE